MKFSIKDFFTEEMLNEKLHFFVQCSASKNCKVIKSFQKEEKYFNALLK